jgi:hypothetical protein
VVVAYGTCVGSWDKFNRWVVPRVGDRPLLGLAGQHSIATAYNSILDAYRGRGLDALVLLHDDLEILDPAAEEKFLNALDDSKVALVGVAGSNLKSMHWWNGRTLGHQYTDSGLLDFGERWGDALMLEGSILVLSPVMIENLRFDTRYPGFLGYDDVCLTVWTQGFKSVVVNVATHHHSTVGIKSVAVQRDWDRTERLFNRKWGIG